ncbi:MFS transporter [Meridianimarinicoccus roseus]|uniref:MFS transporter n=1 Tax=Meridianimarinicoccus roseus TaxID=2072018 RepID=A0A2V2LEE7_9RHOB|nr:MFS transporter [Meridianimarinicoccus roseus]PWR03795.1 MFS transporter [Meridianimarinicoccus roseus]
MINVLSGVWALLLGIVLIMLGNGMHFTLIGLRGGIEGFSSAELAIVTSGYFVGFLSGAQLTPLMIRRVGHVRVFAALGSFMSAGLIAFPLLTEPWAWTVLRLLIGFCMSGIYVAAESWLNNAATNTTRGKVLAAYMIAQTLGIIGAQALLTLGDAATSVLFIGASILVSVSFAPILLSVTPVPAAQVARPMGIRSLFVSSPLGTIGIFLLGSVYATQSGMGAVFGTQIGMTASQISLFVAMLFAGALVLQYPVGWLSDRMDRRKLIFGAALLGGLICIGGWFTGDDLWLLMAAAFVAGGVTTPLYALFLAYTNDFLSPEDMPSASGGLVFTFGLGAITGPLVTGWAMQGLGPFAFWLVLAATFGAIALYALYRMTQRSSAPTSETESYLGVLPTASAVAVEAAGAWAAEQAEGESAGAPAQNTGAAAGAGDADADDEQDEEIEVIAPDPQAGRG